MKNNSSKKIQALLKTITQRVEELEAIVNENICSCYEKGCDCRCWEPCECTIEECECVCCKPKEDIFCEEDEFCSCEDEWCKTCESDEPVDYCKLLEAANEKLENEENIANEIIIGTKKVYADKIINIIIGSEDIDTED